MKKRKVTDAMRSKHWGKETSEKMARLYPGAKGYQAEKERLENNSGGSRS